MQNATTEQSLLVNLLYPTGSTSGDVGSALSESQQFKRACNALRRYRPPISVHSSLGEAAALCGSSTPRIQRVKNPEKYCPSIAIYRFGPAG